MSISDLILEEGKAVKKERMYEEKKKVGVFDKDGWCLVRWMSIEGGCENTLKKKSEVDGVRDMGFSSLE